MKKYIVGAIISAGILVGGYAFASSSPLTLVDTSPDKAVLKYYDSNANVICYVADSEYITNHSLGISCLKNN